MFESAFNYISKYAGWVLIICLLFVIAITFFITRALYKRDAHVTPMQPISDSLVIVNSDITRAKERLKEDSIRSHGIIVEQRNRIAQLESENKALQQKKVTLKNRYDKIETSISSIASKDSLRKLFTE